MLQPQLDYYDMGDGVVAFSTTRMGGCSTGNYDSFNINAYCGDDEEHIRCNRETLCRLLGIGDDRLLMPHQVHQTKMICIDEPLLRHHPMECRQLMDGFDALMTDIPSVCIRQSGVCTYQQCDRYFSARRLGIHSGRIFTGIMLRE